MTDREDRSPAGSRIRRRDFLVWSSAAAMAPALEGIAFAQGGRAAASPAAEQPWRSMSVGFVAGSEAWPSLRRLAAGTLARGHRGSRDVERQPLEVVPAAQLGVGDQALASGSVRVGIRGLYPIPNPRHVLQADLTVLFPSPEPGVPHLPFYAWSYRGKPAPSPSPPLEFTAPLGVDGSFQLQFEVVPGQTRQLITRRATLGLPPEDPGGRFAADFTVDWYEGRPKLQRGVYLLGLAGNTWNASRSLPIHQPRAARPLELLTMIVTIDPLVE